MILLIIVLNVQLQLILVNSNHHCDDLVDGVYEDDRTSLPHLLDDSRLFDSIQHDFSSI